MLTPSELLESLDRHFMAGCGFLDGRQLEAHERDGTCPECRARAVLTSKRAAGVVRDGT